MKSLIVIGLLALGLAACNPNDRTDRTIGGAAIGASGAELVSGAIAGVFGAILGTLGGRAVRGKLAAAFGKDLPAALLEDAVAIALAVYLIIALS